MFGLLSPQVAQVPQVLQGASRVSVHLTRGQRHRRPSMVYFAALGFHGAKVAN